MVLHTRLCDLLEIEYPILNAPMGGGDAPAELAAAVSEAGGLGLIGGTTREGVPWLVSQIRRARELTDRPFGVGFISHFPGAAELMVAALDEGSGSSRIRSRTRPHSWARRTTPEHWCSAKSVRSTVLDARRPRVSMS